MRWGQARALARRLGVPLAAERVPLAATDGRVLAEPLCAATALPGFDTAAMDGYAVAGSPPWRLVGRVLAGATAVPVLRGGTAVEIATGAPVPAGAGAVVPYERAALDGSSVIRLADDRPHIRRAGEDCVPGEELAPAGHPVTAALRGLAAHAGLDLLTVRRRPAVRLLVTGDEVTDRGVPGPGQVRDALGPLIAALLCRVGADLTAAERVPDRRGALGDALGAATENVVIVTGASSVGVTDRLHADLATLGARLHVDGVACRPGHPQTLAEAAPGRWVVGLPGNPYAGLVAALTLLVPLLAGLAGRAAEPRVTGPVVGAVRPLPGATRLVPVRWEGGRLAVVAASRPASLRAAALADAVAVIEPAWVPGAPTELLALP
ncbi:MAG TPA: molybdopterin molybdotransferase MoeA [Pilimelia sp.]|nr:molybdopterin molybdotransferase MoeA [Pilimelia sp.]